MAIRKPHIHVETTNISFLQVHSDLKSLGIKNNKFFLALYDKSLRNVDPYAKDLTREQIERIITECVINPWYFKREVARIPTPGGFVRFELNRGNLAASWCYHRHIDHYFVIPRQCGKTQSELSDILWSFLFGADNSDFSFSHMKLDGSVANLDRLKAQRDLLPKYMQFKIAISEDGKLDDGADNVKTLVCPANGNKIVTRPGATSAQKADQLGRGATEPVQLLDEVDFTPFIDIMLAAMGPAFGEASRKAKLHGSAYGRIFISTPGDLDSPAGAAAMTIIDKTAKWDEKFYDNPTDVDEYLAINSENGIMYIEYDYRSIGKDEQWFRESCKYLNGDPYKIKRELLLKRMRGSQMSPYEPKELEEIQDMTREPISSIFINRYFKLDIYEELNRDIAYIIGVDVSSGKGVDNSAVTIINPHTCKPVAEFKSPFILTTQLRDFLRQLIIQICPMGLLCIESNNQGIALIQMLLETDVRSRVYYDTTKMSHEADMKPKFDDAGWLKHQSANQGAYGVWTGQASREIMFDILQSHVSDHKDRLLTKNIVSDIFKLVRMKNGKIAAAAGFHDDSIMSYLIGMYVWYYSKSLSKFGVSKVNLDLYKEDKDPEMEKRDLLEESKAALEMLGWEDTASIDYAEYAAQQARAMRQRVVQEHEDFVANNGGQETAFSMDYYGGDNNDAYDDEDDFFDSMNSSIPYEYDNGLY